MDRRGAPPRQPRPRPRCAIGGEVLQLPGRRVADAGAAVPGRRRAPLPPLDGAVYPACEAVAYLGRHGRPIAYSHLADGLPLGDHQTVYADEPGSAEMPSAGRPFTAALLVRPHDRGRHRGSSDAARGRLQPGAPRARRRRSATPSRRRHRPARRRHATRAGRRVIAVGTTVVRALETVAEPAWHWGSHGVDRPGAGPASGRRAWSTG